MSELLRLSFDFPEPECPRLKLAIFAGVLVILCLFLASGTAMATNQPPEIPFWFGSILFFIGGILALAATGHGNFLVFLIGVVLCTIAMTLTSLDRRPENVRILPELEFHRHLPAIFAGIIAIVWAGTAMATNDLWTRQASQIERLTTEDRMICEDRRAHARLAYKELIFDRCVANFIAKYERKPQ